MPTIEDLRAPDAEWRKDFENCIKRGIVKSLHGEKLLNDEQLNILLAKYSKHKSNKNHEKSRKFADFRGK